MALLNRSGVETMRTLLIIVIFFLLAIGGHIWFAEEYSVGQARVLLEQCSDRTTAQHLTCLQAHFATMAQTNPGLIAAVLQGIVRLAQQNALPIEARWYSALAHSAGADLIAASETVPQAIGYCPSTFNSGCVHGAVMAEALRRYGVPAVVPAFAELTHLCTELNWWERLQRSPYMNCLHGVGHSLMMLNPNQSPSALLADCATLTHRTEQMACGSGVFMEYSTSAAGKVGTVALPCADLTEQWQGVCYTSAGSYRQYEPGHESFAETYHWCEQVPEQYRFGCEMGVAERLLLSHGGNQAAALEECVTLSPAMQRLCSRRIKSARWLWLWNMLPDKLKG